MAYTLEGFCRDCHAALKADPGPGGRQAVRGLLERLLADRDFLAAHVLSAPPGRHTLYEDPELGFVVLAHVNPTAGKSPPHDHGASWAVYGQVTEHTDMTEWRRAEGGDAPGPASQPQSTKNECGRVTARSTASPATSTACSRPGGAGEDAGGRAAASRR